MMLSMTVMCGMFISAISSADKELLGLDLTQLNKPPAVLTNFTLICKHNLNAFVGRVYFI